MNWTLFVEGFLKMVPNVLGIGMFCGMIFTSVIVIFIVYLFLVIIGNLFLYIKNHKVKNEK